MTPSSHCWRCIELVREVNPVLLRRQRVVIGQYLHAPAGSAGGCAAASLQLDLWRTQQGWVWQCRYARIVDNTRSVSVRFMMDVARVSGRQG